MMDSAGRTLKTFAMIVIALAAMTTPVHAQESPAGKPASGFTIRDMEGHLQTYRSLRGRATVVIFFSTRCPMSNAFNYRRNVLYHDFGNRVRFIVVDSNFNESLDEVRTYAEETGFDFPVYQDVDNQLADSLGARSTTDTFLLDATGTTRYRGYIEDAPNPARTTKQGLRLALDAVLADQPVAMPETKAVGCAIRRPHAVSVATTR
jgi:peroxiredoxin